MAADLRTGLVLPVFSIPMKTIALLCVVSALGQNVQHGAALESPRGEMEELKRLRDSWHVTGASRRTILVDLAKTAHESVATDAFTLLVRNNDLDGVALSKALISRTTGTEYIGRVLGAAANYFTPAERHEIARQFLHKVEAGLQAEKPGYPMVSLAGYAAVLLSDSQSPADQNLVQSNWERDPEEFGYLAGC